MIGFTDAYTQRWFPICVSWNLSYSNPFLLLVPTLTNKTNNNLLDKILPKIPQNIQYPIQMSHRSTLNNRTTSSKKRTSQRNPNKVVKFIYVEVLTRNVPCFNIFRGLVYDKIICGERETPRMIPFQCILGIFFRAPLN